MARTLVFIVTYNASRHVTGLLARIPSSLFGDSNVHFLLIDDASVDDTAEIAGRWIDSHRVERFVVLRNPINQGYGGNQKLGFRY